ncbi:hypothetical protein [Plantibacter flavus]|nr:hypothetical protein [Plantibacter flavus]
MNTFISWNLWAVTAVLGAGALVVCGAICVRRHLRRRDLRARRRE